MNISSRENPAIKRLVRLQKSRDFRDQMGVFVCEGMTLLLQARHLELEAVYCLDPLVEALPPWLTCPVYTVEAGVMDKISDTKTPQGLVFTCRIPPALPPAGTRFLAVEDLRDPGNVGAVLRTAEAFSLDGILLVGSCADVYSPKVVRSAMGSVFRLPTHAITVDGLVAFCRDRQLRLIGAALGEQSLPLGSVSLQDAVVAVGNEAHGLSAALLAACDSQVMIPIAGVQSLNAAVAAAILMWEMRGQ